MAQKSMCTFFGLWLMVFVSVLYLGFQSPLAPPPCWTSWATVENTDWSGISTDVDLLEELCGFVLERRWILDGRFYLRGCLEFCVEHPASDFREFPCNANLVVQVNTAGSAEMFMLAFANHLHSLPLCRGRNKIPGVSGLDQMD